MQALRSPQPMDRTAPRLLVTQVCCETTKQWEQTVRGLHNHVFWSIHLWQLPFIRLLSRPAVLTYFASKPAARGKIPSIKVEKRLLSPPRFGLKQGHRSTITPRRERNQSGRDCGNDTEHTLTNETWIRIQYTGYPRSINTKVDKQDALTP